MTRQEKDQLIDELTQVLQEKNVLYLTDASGLDAEATTLLRRESFKNNITLRVVRIHFFARLWSVLIARTSKSCMAPWWDKQL